MTAKTILRYCFHGTVLTLAAAGWFLPTREPVARARTADLRASAPPQSPTEVVPLENPRINVERSLVERPSEELATLTRAVRVVPEQRDGKVVGMRLFGIRPGTLLGALGLENGDRVETVNGFDITNPETALEAYARLRTASRLRVHVNRRGSPVDIDLNII